MIGLVRLEHGRGIRRLEERMVKARKVLPGCHYARLFGTDLVDGPFGRNSWCVCVCVPLPGAVGRR